MKNDSYRSHKSRLMTPIGVVLLALVNACEENVNQLFPLVNGGSEVVPDGAGINGTPPPITIMRADWPDGQPRPFLVTLHPPLPNGGLTDSAQAFMGPMTAIVKWGTGDSGISYAYLDWGSAWFDNTRPAIPVGNLVNGGQTFSVGGSFVEIAAQNWGNTLLPLGSGIVYADALDILATASVTPASLGDRTSKLTYTRHYAEINVASGDSAFFQAPPFATRVKFIATSDFFGVSAQLAMTIDRILFGNTFVQASIVAAGNSCPWIDVLHAEREFRVTNDSAGTAAYMGAIWEIAL